MEDEFLSVEDFAKRAGVSKQSVYQRLNTSLKVYSRVEQGKKVISTKALLEIYGLNLEQGFQGNSQDLEQDFQGLNQGLIQGLNQEIKHLQELLKSKEQTIDLLQRQVTDQLEQLRSKDQQVQELHKLLDQEQQLNAKRILALEEKSTRKRNWFMSWLHGSNT